MVGSIAMTVFDNTGIVDVDNWNWDHPTLVYCVILN